VANHFNQPQCVGLHRAFGAAKSQDLLAKAKQMVLDGDQPVKQCHPQADWAPTLDRHILVPCAAFVGTRMARSPMVPRTTKRKGRPTPPIRN